VASLTLCHKQHHRTTSVTWLLLHLQPLQ